MEIMMQVVVATVMVVGGSFGGWHFAGCSVFSVHLRGFYVFHTVHNAAASRNSCHLQFRPSDSFHDAAASGKKRILCLLGDILSHSIMSDRQ
jgi:hypothetical protein